jgi:hypothetical protein
VRKLATRSLKFRVRTLLPITLQHRAPIINAACSIRAATDRGDVPAVGCPKRLVSR